MLFLISMGGGSLIHRISEKIAFLFSEKKIITEDMIEIHIFSLECMITTAINIVLLILLSCFFGVFTESLFMIIPFMIIRSKAGGFHAKTHFGCIMGFMITYIFSVILLRIIPQNIYHIYVLISIITLPFLIIKYGVIPSINYEVTLDEKNEFIKESKRLSFILSLITLAVFFISPYYGCFMAHGLLIASGSMIVELIKIKKEYVKNE